MKKYFSYVAVALVALFTSCSNDDITIETSYTFNVNASTVISSFVEVKPGELETFQDVNEKLRIRILIYNDNGELVAQDQGYFTNYNTQLKTVKNLSSGTYTVIGISDVVVLNGNSIKTEFWHLSGESKLSEMKIEDGGMLGYEARILGIAKNTLNIKANESSSLSVDLKPAGALIYSIIWNTGYFSDVEKYWLMANKSSEALSYDASGNYVITEKNDGSKVYKIVGVTAGAENENTYYYNYILPMSNLNLYFECTDTDGDNHRFEGLTGTTISLSAGDEYACHLDLYNWGDYYKKVTSESAFNYPGPTSAPAKLSRKEWTYVNKTAMIPNEIFSKLNRVLKASDIK